MFSSVSAQSWESEHWYYSTSLFISKHSDEKKLLAAFFIYGRLFPHDDKKYTRVNVETSAPEEPHKLYYLPPGSWGRCCLSGWRLLNEFISGLKTSSPFFFFLLLLLSIAVYIKQFFLSVSFAVHIRLGCNPACYYMTNTNWLWWSRRCGWELSWKPVALAWLKLFFNQGGLY